MPATVLTPITPAPSPLEEAWTPAQTTLIAGDRLSRAEFERRYEATPQIKKAELIEGVVYMPSPILIDHGEAQGTIIGWLVTYGMATPGVQYAGNASVRLDLDNEVQPDALLRLHTRAGGRSHIGKKRLIDGAPELVVEIALSSTSYDLHDKLKVYRRNGVQEYLVWRVLDGAIDWFAFDEGEYIGLPMAEDGIVRSRVFPGLWLAVPALLQGDLAAVMAALQEGLRSPEHGEFAGRLAALMQ